MLLFNQGKICYLRKVSRRGLRRKWTGANLEWATQVNGTAGGTASPDIIPGLVRNRKM